MEDKHKLLERGQVGSTSHEVEIDQNREGGGLEKEEGKRASYLQNLQMKLSNNLKEIDEEKGPRSLLRTARVRVKDLQGGGGKGNKEKKVLFDAEITQSDGRHTVQGHHSGKKEEINSAPKQVVKMVKALLEHGK